MSIKFNITGFFPFGFLKENPTQRLVENLKND